MDAASTAESGKEESSGVSDFPDFAEIYLFLENFGSYINLPRINLRELENFFINGKCIIKLHYSCYCQVF